jgi:AcrR family transcriptional regulator
MSVTDEPRVGERRPGGRAARVRTAVLRATAELLDSVGYEGVSYDEVARRAEVHKTTVYRRWPSKPELVADAVGLHSEEQVPIPDTGALATDLAALAASVAANLTAPGGERRSRSIVAAAATADDLAEALHVFMVRRITLAEPIVERAVARGELPAGVDARIVVEALVGPIWFRLLLTGEPLDDEFLDGVVAVVVRGAGAPDPSR